MSSVPGRTLALRMRLKAGRCRISPHTAQSPTSSDQADKGLLKRLGSSLMEQQARRTAPVMRRNSVNMTICLEERFWPTCHERLTSTDSTQTVQDGLSPSSCTPRTKAAQPLPPVSEPLQEGPGPCVQAVREGVGRRGRDRTCNPELRRLVLYPIELLARVATRHGIIVAGGWRAKGCFCARLGTQVVGTRSLLRKSRTTASRAEAQLRPRRGRRRRPSGFEVEA